MWLAICSLNLCTSLLHWMDSLCSLVSRFGNRKWCFEMRQCKVTLVLICLSAFIKFEPSGRSGIWKEGKVSPMVFLELEWKRMAQWREGLADWVTVYRVSLNCHSWGSKTLQLSLLWEKVQSELNSFSQAESIQL